MPLGEIAVSQAKAPRGLSILADCILSQNQVPSATDFGPKLLMQLSMVACALRVEQGKIAGPALPQLLWTLCILPVLGDKQHSIVDRPHLAHICRRMLSHQIAEGAMQDTVWHKDRKAADRSSANHSNCPMQQQQPQQHELQQFMAQVTSKQEELHASSMQQQQSLPKRDVASIKALRERIQIIEDQVALCEPGGACPLGQEGGASSQLLSL